MTDFTGMNCPVCGKPFQPGDDVVVCPECGAPYHRACYQQVGHCLYESKHGTPDAWQPPHTEQDNNVQRCPQCGHENAAGLLFCEHCGTPLVQNNVPKHEPQPTYGQFPYGQQQTNGQTPPPGWPYGQLPFVFDPMAGIDPNEPVDGVKAGDLAKVVQSNTTYYLPVFLAHEKYHKGRFNFAAFLLGGAWLLYRKLYFLGTIFTCAELFLSVVSQFLAVRYTSTVLLQVMNSLGISSTTSITAQQMSQIAGKIVQLPTAQWLLFMLPEFLSLLIFIAHIVLGCIANRLYRKHCVQQVHNIQAEGCSESDTLIRFQEKGGVNTALLTAILVCFLIASNAINFF